MSWKLPFLLTTFAALSAVQAFGQEASVIERLRRAEDEYDLAASDYETAVEARDIRYQRWQEELQNVRSLSKDDDRYPEAQANFKTASLELTSADRRVDATEEALKAAGGRLLAVLDERRNTLAAEVASSTGEEARQGRIRLEDTLNRMRSLQSSLAEPTPEPPLDISITMSPRDDRQTLEAKLSVLEGRIEEADTQLVRTDRDIQDLERQQRMERSGQDFMAGVDRYGAAAPPTGPPDLGPVRAGATPADSAAVRDDRPLNERILELQIVRQNLENFIERANVQVEEFHRRLRVITQ